MYLNFFFIFRVTHVWTKSRSCLRGTLLMFNCFVYCNELLRIIIIRLEAFKRFKKRELPADQVWKWYTGVTILFVGWLIRKFVKQSTFKGFDGEKLQWKLSMINIKCSWSGHTSASGVDWYVCVELLALGFTLTLMGLCRGSIYFQWQLLSCSFGLGYQGRSEKLL